MQGTYRAAREAVDVALTGADLVREGAADVFVLCRPPGHHAEHDRMGGFCYFNNAVVAAHRLSGDGRVAILDVDYHHGNGSQHLTYTRDDILYVSLHADPRFAYPGFSGHANERGRGAGLGFNLNLPLPPHMRIDAYLEELDRACEAIAAFDPRTLVVSLGFDTHREDPIAILGLWSEDFGRVAERIASLGRPRLHVLEGGYALEPAGRVGGCLCTGAGGRGDGRVAVAAKRPAQPRLHATRIVDFGPGSVSRGSYRCDTGGRRSCRPASTRETRMSLSIYLTFDGNCREVFRVLPVGLRRRVRDHHDVWGRPAGHGRAGGRAGPNHARVFPHRTERADGQRHRNRLRTSEGQGRQLLSLVRDPIARRDRRAVRQNLRGRDRDDAAGGYVLGGLLRARAWTSSGSTGSSTGSRGRRFSSVGRR